MNRCTLPKRAFQSRVQPNMGKGNSSWQENEIILFCAAMKDLRVNEDAKVTDNLWKNSEENFKKVQEKLKENDSEWRWDAKQMMNKWKNVLQDYYKVKTKNATTGEIRRTAPAMDILDECVPQTSPMISNNGVDSLETSELDTMPKPAKRQ